MKAALLPLVWIIASQAAFAQGSFELVPIGRPAPSPLQFFAALEPIPGSASYTRSGQAFFSLQGNLFSGTAVWSADHPEEINRVENRNGDVIANLSSRYVDPLQPGSTSPWGTGHATWDPMPLSQSQIQELLRGDWFVYIGINPIDNYGIRGQLVLVPEPSPFALLGAGFLAAAVPSLRRKFYLPGSKSRAAELMQ